MNNFQRFLIISAPQRAAKKKKGVTYRRLIIWKVPRLGNESKLKISGFGDDLHVEITNTH